jgi:hypothetical protein
MTADGEGRDDFRLGEDASASDAPKFEEMRDIYRMNYTTLFV